MQRFSGAASWHELQDARTDPRAGGTSHPQQNVSWETHAAAAAPATPQTRMLPPAYSISADAGRNNGLGMSYSMGALNAGTNGPHQQQSTSQNASFFNNASQTVQPKTLMSPSQFIAQRNAMKRQHHQLANSNRGQWSTPNLQQNYATGDNLNTGFNDMHSNDTLQNAIFDPVPFYDNKNNGPNNALQRHVLYRRHQQQEQQKKLLHQSGFPSFAIPTIPEETDTKLQFAAAMHQESLLHNSCKLYPDTISVVESALRFDPEAIRRSVPIACNDQDDQQKQRPAKRVVRERYSYPINIALKYQASRDILELLIREGPDVLAMPDGPDNAGSLTIAILMHQDINMIRCMVRSNPNCPQVADRHLNFPLHIAARCLGTSLEVIKIIYQAYPEAITKTNFHGQTPVDVAIKSASCPEQTVNYLQSIAFGKLEASLESNIDDHLFVGF